MNFFCIYKLSSVSLIQQTQLGEMGEWLKSAVLKTVVPKGTGGSNPSLSAKKLSRFRPKKNKKIWK
jgi:hypothetical protein